MQVDVFSRPRLFSVGPNDIALAHVANIALPADEMVTFVGDGDREYDVTAKSWGYYVTPSLGSRLRRFRMRAALMRNLETRQMFVVVVFDECLSAWETYMKAEHQELVLWLDEVE